MQEYLGVSRRTTPRGACRTCTGAAAAFGYFPTYALGNVIAGQLCEAARADLAELDEMLAGGELSPLREWLRENMHRHGQVLAAEMIRRVTGGPTDAEPLLRHLEERYVEVYGLG